MPRAPRALAALTLLAIAGCLARPSELDDLNRQAPQDFRGHYTPGDGSWFQPCGTTSEADRWWVTATDRAVVQLDSARRGGQLADGRASYVHWRAVRTRSAKVGPPGREALLVREVVVVRPGGERDCASS